MNDNLLAVNEIYYSIDGEGARAGFPATFVRLAGCNLHCDYCDTTYAKAMPGRTMPIDEAVRVIRSFGCRAVTVTGGEPLLQRATVPLLRELSGHGMDIAVETNGSLDIAPILPYAAVCMDWKAPASGMGGRMLEANLPLLREGDILKIVVRPADLPFVARFLAQHRLRCPVYLSPVWSKIPLGMIADFVKAYSGPNTVRMQVQLHKIIWGAEARGV